MRKQDSKPVWELAHVQAGVICRRQLLDLGLTRWQIKAQLRAGRPPERTDRVSDPSTHERRRDRGRPPPGSSGDCSRSGSFVGRDRPASCHSHGDDRPTTTDHGRGDRQSFTGHQTTSSPEVPRAGGDGFDGRHSSPQGPPLSLPMRCARTTYRWKQMLSSGFRCWG